jgi:hypothetical protein
MAEIDVRRHLTMKLADVPPHWRVVAICLRCSHCAPLPIAHLVLDRSPQAEDDAR